ncbi:MAG: SWIM zinc finger family protein [Bryobacter sp.]
MLAELWREEIMSYPVGSQRIEDGQRYFARGAVQGLRGGVGHLEAEVQGFSETPYKVEVRLELLPPEIWERLKNWLQANDWDKSELEQGRLTTAFSIQLESLGIRLVPKKYKEIQVTCTCQDWMRPCKHVLAVLFAFGLEVEHDPLALLRIRGAGELEEAVAQEPLPEEKEDPLRANAQEFWEGTADLDALSLEVSADQERPFRRYLPRLGPLQFWGGSFDLHNMTRGIYEAVRQKKSG